MKIPREFYNTAIHEAGHAVVAAAVGVGIVRRGMWANGDQVLVGGRVHLLADTLGALVRCRETGERADAEGYLGLVFRFLTASIAGDESVRLFGEPEDGGNSYDMADDVAQRRTILHAIRPERQPGALLEAAREVAREILSKNAAGVRALAASLMERGSVSVEEIRELTGLEVHTYEEGA